jgi:hypothetical protein
MVPGTDSQWGTVLMIHALGNARAAILTPWCGDQVLGGGGFLLASPTLWLPWLGGWAVTCRGLDHRDDARP